MTDKEKKFNDLTKAILEYDSDAAMKIAEKAVKEKADLLAAIEVMSEALRTIGDKFAAGEVYLPHLVMASDAMIAATDIFSKVLTPAEMSKNKKGTIVMGTVEGDLHDVGLNIVSMTLTTSGFEVHNLGKDTTVEKFINKAKEVNADIIGASTLLTVTRSKQRDLVDEIKYQKLPYMVMVGGGPVTAQWAKEIDADGYGADSNEAVETAKNLMKKKKKEK